MVERGVFEDSEEQVTEQAEDWLLSQAEARRAVDALHWAPDDDWAEDVYGIIPQGGGRR